MNILAFDTSTDACSAALLITGKSDKIISRFQIAPCKHTDLILSMISEVLQEAGLSKREVTAIAFGHGPGAFTGVRIATAIAQGLGYSLDRPVIPISTLAALAQQAIQLEGSNKILTALDARMGEVYWSSFIRNSKGYAEELAQPVVVAADQVPTPEGNAWTAVGNGWSEYASLFETLSDKHISVTIASIYPRAEEIAVLAVHSLKENSIMSCSEPVLPLYLRNNVAEKSATYKNK